MPAADLPCCEPVVYPDVERDHALRMAEVAKALGDPIRLQLVDVLRKHAGKVCVAELLPLFHVTQPTLSHHLRRLRDAGIVGFEKQGAWAYYFVLPGALDELAAWLGLGEEQHEDDEHQEGRERDVDRSDLHGQALPRRAARHAAALPGTAR